VTENGQIDTILVNISKPDGNVEIETLTPNGTPLFEFNFTNTTLFGNYFVRFIANDTRNVGGDDILNSENKAF